MHVPVEVRMVGANAGVEHRPGDARAIGAEKLVERSVRLQHAHRPPGQLRLARALPDGVDAHLLVRAADLAQFRRRQPRRDEAAQRVDARLRPPTSCPRVCAAAPRLFDAVLQLQRWDVVDVLALEPGLLSLLHRLRVGRDARRAPHTRAPAPRSAPSVAPAARAPSRSATSRASTKRDIMSRRIASLTTLRTFGCAR